MKTPVKSTTKKTAVSNSATAGKKSASAADKAKKDSKLSKPRFLDDDEDDLDFMPMDNFENLDGFEDLDYDDKF